MTQSTPFDMDSERDADSARLTVAGELDIATVPQLQEAIDSMLSDGVSDLLLDLRQLAFIDSSGLRMLILLSSRADGEGWTLRLLRPADRSLSVFEITGADENLPFVEESSAP